MATCRKRESIPVKGILRNVASMSRLELPPHRGCARTDVRISGAGLGSPAAIPRDGEEEEEWRGAAITVFA